MSNLYKLTQNLHKIIQEKAKKYGLELVIKSDKIIYWDNFPEKPSDYHIGDSSMLVNAPDKPTKSAKSCGFLEMFWGRILNGLVLKNSIVMNFATNVVMQMKILK